MLRLAIAIPEGRGTPYGSDVQLGSERARLTTDTRTGDGRDGWCSSENYGKQTP
jgi:hypothetical protein